MINGRRSAADAGTITCVRILRFPLLFLVVVPAFGALVPSLIWIAFLGSSGHALLVLIMASLVATARFAMHVLDRLGMSGMWTCLAWVIAAATVGIAISDAILHAGEATY